MGNIIFESGVCNYINEEKPACTKVAGLISVQGENIYFVDSKYDSEESFIADLNLNIKFDGKAKIFKGSFKAISSNNSNIFIPIKKESEYTHILIEIEWGGKDNTSRGIIDNMISEQSSRDIILSKYCPSDDGNSGYTYILVTRDFINKPEMGGDI